MNETSQRVVVTDLRIPFFRLVLFFVKATLAAIPATIFVGLLLMLLWMALVLAIGWRPVFFIQPWTF